MYIWCVDDEKERIALFAKRFLLSKYHVRIISSLSSFQRALDNPEFIPDLIFADYKFEGEGNIIDFISEHYSHDFPYHFMICSAYYDNRMILHASQVSSNAISAIPKELEVQKRFDGFILPEERRFEIDAWVYRNRTNPDYYYQKFGLEISKQKPREIFEYIIKNSENEICAQKLLSNLSYDNYSYPENTLHNHLSDLRKSISLNPHLDFISDERGYRIERKLPSEKLLGD